MKKSKLNSKILSYVLGIAISTSLSGCGDNYKRFEYNTNSQGDIIVDGNISYEILCDYKLIELKLLDKNELYIVKEVLCDRFRVGYMNIFTGKEICKSDSKDIVKIYNLSEYLLSYNEVKNEYTISDVERIYDEIKDNYEYKAEKTKVKE